MIKLLREFFAAIWEVFKLPLFLVGEGFHRMFRLGWRKLVMLAAAAFLLFAISMTTFFEITSQPQFCSSCHLMKPYIANWKESSHHEVACMECHAQQGLTGFLETKFTAASMLVNYATGLYKRSKPWAEIEDNRCHKCHETRLLDGKIDYGGVIFDHTPHLTETRRGRKLRCTSCHSQIVQGEHISVTSSTCFLCHFKNIEQEGREELAQCMKCHPSPPTGEAAEAKDLFDHKTILKNDIDCHSCHQTMRQGTGLVREERCGVCHSQAAHLERINDLEFIHEWHIERRKIECQLCHDPISHIQEETAEFVGSDCAECHYDHHRPKVKVYMGTGARLAPEPMPDVMNLSGVVCQSCHKEAATGQSMAHVDEKACTPCHDKSYFRLTHDWRKSYSRRIEKLERAMRHAGTHPQLEDARHDLALIKRGGAWHNPKFSTEVLGEVSKVIMEAGGSPPSYPDMPAGSQRCLSCHIGAPELDVSLEMTAFNHGKHQLEKGIACIRCHVNNTPDDPGHGNRLPVGKSCIDCHHGAAADASESCAPCHEPSRRLYTGDLSFAGAGPSPMADMGMECTDCHNAEENYAPPKGEFCLDCHDQEVVDDLDFLRGELLNLLKRHDYILDKNVKTVFHDRGRAVHHPGLARDVLGGGAGRMKDEG